MLGRIWTNKSQSHLLRRRSVSSKQLGFHLLPTTPYFELLFITAGK
nr:MAG TPA: hypothetical protein [Caudoviricetes sp.]